METYNLVINDTTITLTFEHDEYTGEIGVSESLTGWDGFGRTKSEAIADLIECMLNDYVALSGWDGALAEHVQYRLIHYRKLLGE